MGNKPGPDMTAYAALRDEYEAAGVTRRNALDGDIQALFDTADTLTEGINAYAKRNGRGAWIGPATTIELAHCLAVFVCKQPPEIQAALLAYYRARLVTR